jgi:MFS superfamily sulfate permease-like transporter
MRALVAFTPLVGSIFVPVIVPVLMVRFSIAAGVATAVVASCLWFTLMLSTAEMPGHS